MLSKEDGNFANWNYSDDVNTWSWEKKLDWAELALKCFIKDNTIIKLN